MKLKSLSFNTDGILSFRFSCFKLTLGIIQLSSIINFHISHFFLVYVIVYKLVELSINIYTVTTLKINEMSVFLLLFCLLINLLSKIDFCNL